MAREDLEYEYEIGYQDPPDRWSIRYYNLTEKFLDMILIHVGRKTDEVRDERSDRTKESD